MHHQSKERNMSKSKKKKKKLTRAFPFGLTRFRFNEVRINEVPLYILTMFGKISRVFGGNWEASKKL